jgi:hypothetical protein
LAPDLCPAPAAGSEALPARTQPLRQQNAESLLHFAMIRVLAALTAKLAELETFGRGFTILGRRVVFILAHSALQLTNFTSH